MNNTLYVLIYLVWGLVFMGIYSKYYFPFIHVYALWKRKDDSEIYKERLAKRKEQEDRDALLGVGKVLIFLFWSILEPLMLIVFIVVTAWLFFYRGFKFRL